MDDDKDNNNKEDEDPTTTTSKIGSTSSWFVTEAPPVPSLAPPFTMLFAAPLLSLASPLLSLLIVLTVPRWCLVLLSARLLTNTIRTRSLLQIS